MASVFHSISCPAWCGFNGTYTGLMTYMGRQPYQRSLFVVDWWFLFVIPLWTYIFAKKMWDQAFREKKIEEYAIRRELPEAAHTSIKNL